MSKFEGLNDRQLEAVRHREGPLLILAGAGSGKTRVLTHRIAYLIDECGVRPWNILAITFTNKAAGEMRERVDSLVDAFSESVWVSTFHALCVRILRRFADRIGFSGSFSIYDAEDQKAVMKDVLKRLNLDPKQFKEKAMLSAISRAKDVLKTPELYAREAYDHMEELIARAYRLYQETLVNNNAMDFDDLLLNTVSLFTTQPEVLESYRQRFRYVMVDEYQDTNTAQFELVRLLTEGHRNLCVVGDDDQSIYKFRGANIRNILEFEDTYPEAKVIKLEQNYRSTQNILDAANGVIKNNRSRKAKSLWTDRGRGELIHFREYDTAKEEAMDIVSVIRAHMRKGRHLSDHAVLYRTNAQSRLLEEAFILEGIPYRVVGGQNFYGRKEIKDMLAYLKTVENGSDDLAVKRIINVPARGIGNTTIGRIQSFSEKEEISFLEAMDRAPEIPGIGKAAGRLDDFLTLIRDFRQGLQAGGSLSGLLEQILNKTGYREMLKTSGDEEDQDRLSNIEELKTKIVSFEENTEEPTLSGFLQEVALVAEIDSVDADQDKVLLMTLHSAKGLEFPCVFLSGLEDGIFPSFMTIVSGDESDMEEERRLAYVGITRAMEELYLSAARSRMINGQTQYNAVSRFVKEIPPELLDNRPVRKLSDRDQAPAPKASGLTKPAAAKPFQLTRLKKGAELAGGKPDYGKGDRVSHIKFGEGTVLDLTKDTKDYKVTVDFDGAGTKILYAGFAKLKKL